MISAGNPEITDELLSAYIDDAVTEAERKLIETAVASDPVIAWRLASLQETVRLLRVLPSLATPRSFLLTPEQVRQGTMTVAVPPAHTPISDSGGFWSRLRDGWQTFWRAGNLTMRNAMAASFAVLLVLLIGPAMIQPATSAQTTLLQTPANRSLVNAEALRQSNEQLADSTHAASEALLRKSAATTVPIATTSLSLAQDDASTRATVSEPTVLASVAESPDLRIPAEEGSGAGPAVAAPATTPGPASRSASAEKSMEVAPTPAASLQTQDQSQTASIGEDEPAAVAAAAVPPSAAMAAPLGAAEMSADDGQLLQMAPASAPIAQGDDGAAAMAASESAAPSTAETSVLGAVDESNMPSEEEAEAASAPAPIAILAGIATTTPKLDAAISSEAFAIERTDSYSEPMAADTSAASRPQATAKLPSSQPTATATLAAKTVSAVTESASEQTESAFDPAPVAPLQAAARLPDWLLVSQLVAASGAIVFGLFWIRSRKG